MFRKILFAGSFSNGKRTIMIMQAIFPITTQGLSDSFYTLEIKYNELPRNIPSRCWDYLISLFRVNFCKNCLVKQKKLAGVPAILGHPKMNYWREKYQGTWIYKIFVRKQEEMYAAIDDWSKKHCTQSLSVESFLKLFSFSCLYKIWNIEA